MNPSLIIPIITAYLLGSIPFGILFSKSIKGKDPRAAGSKNIGFTNVLRTIGPLPAILTLIGDVGKGMLAAYIGLKADGSQLGTLCAFLAVLGHCYPIFLKFRGGKAVATGFGVLAILYLQMGLITFGIWLITLAIFRFVALSAIMAFGTLPFLMIFFDAEGYSILFASGLALLIFFRHGSNIRRMLAGEESRIGRKANSP